MNGRGLHPTRERPRCSACGRRQVQYANGRIMHTHGWWSAHTHGCKTPLLTRAVQWLNTALT